MTNIASQFTLDGKLALVTGGGSGIGLAIAQCMAGAGARIVLCGRDEAKLAEAAGAIGAAAQWITHDVTDTKAAPDFSRAVEERFGAVDILVNNAGNHLKKPALDTTEEEFQRILDTHVLGAHALSRHIAPGMIARGGGSILFIASMTSFMGIPLVIAYSAAKSAHLGMVRTLAAEWSPRGVRVNGIAPGWIETAMSRKAMQGDPERERKIISRTPMAKFGEPVDIGMAAVYLCSPAARFVTGVVLPVDGGASIGF